MKIGQTGQKPDSFYQAYYKVKGKGSSFQEYHRTFHRYYGEVFTFGIHHQHICSLGTIGKGYHHRTDQSWLGISKKKREDFGSSKGVK